MNRLVLHASMAPDLSASELVDAAAGIGFDSVGLRVAGVRHDVRRWSKGAGSEELLDTIDRLLSTRVSVADVGQAELRTDVDAAKLEAAHTRVLDFGVRLGAHWATSAATEPNTSRAEVEQLFGAFVRQCAVFQLVPLLVPRPGTAVDSIAVALDVVKRVGGGVVADVSVSTAEAEDTVLEAGNRLGYLRLHGDDLDAVAEDPDQVAGRLATVPAHVPIAVGAQWAAGQTPFSSERASNWRRTIDAMLEHPRARSARLSRRD
jgi:hypothetical protein